MHFADQEKYVARFASKKAKDAEGKANARFPFASFAFFWSARTSSLGLASGRELAM
jgi:hypothetical protein